MKKFTIKVETPGLLINVRGRVIRTPVVLTISKDEVPLITMQLKNNNISYKIEEIIEFDNSSKKDSPIVEIEKEEIPNDFRVPPDITIEELSLKYETLLEKMMKSTEK